GLHREKSGRSLPIGRRACKRAQRHESSRIAGALGHYHGATTTLFSTLDTPGADHAASSACSFACQVRTLPRKTTLLSTASTLIWLASSCARRAKALSIFVLTSATLTRGFTLIRLVMPFTPVV